MPIPDTSRAYAKAHAPEAIAQAARSLGAKAGVAEGFEAALAKLAKERAPIRVLIAGSLHLAGAVVEAEDIGGVVVGDFQSPMLACGRRIWHAPGLAAAPHLLSPYTRYGERQASVVLASRQGRTVLMPLPACGERGE